MADLLDWCRFIAGEDTDDAYHASVFPACTGELVWGWEVVGVEVYEDDEGDMGQRFVRGWRLHVGCWPCALAAGLSPFMREVLHQCLHRWFFLRWAVAHFGQRFAAVR